MDPDLLFVLGCVLGVLTVPALVSAISDGRAPRAPSLLVVMAGGMIAFAVAERPGAYSFETLPDVFAKVISRALN